MGSAEERPVTGSGRPTFPYPVDTGLALFTVDEEAVFRNAVIREFRV
ncbi:hypothetical protein ACFY64_23625 [Streptomyces collinus]